LNKARVAAVAGLVVIALAFMAPASAQTYVNQPVPQAGPSDRGGPGGSGGGAQVLGASNRAQSTPAQATGNAGGALKAQSDFRLALTGGDIAGLIFVGLAVGGTGLLIVRVARRRPTPVRDV
jgi:hypothetical protein